MWTCPNHFYLIPPSCSTSVFLFLTKLNRLGCTPPTQEHVLNRSFTKKPPMKSLTHTLHSSLHNASAMSDVFFLQLGSFSLFWCLHFQPWSYSQEQWTSNLVNKNVTQAAGIKLTTWLLLEKILNRDLRSSSWCFVSHSYYWYTLVGQETENGDWKW